MRRADFTRQRSLVRNQHRPPKAAGLSQFSIQLQYLVLTRARSSAGRALPSHGRGREFESRRVHFFVPIYFFLENHFAFEGGCVSENNLWTEEPPEASAESWTEVWAGLAGLRPSDEDDPIGMDRLLDFVLNEVLRRCPVKAEDRESGILDEQVRQDTESTRSWISGAGS